MKRILFVSHRVPYPPDKGDRLRAFHEIVALSERFRVTAGLVVHRQSDTEAALLLSRWCEKVIVGPARGARRGTLSFVAGRSITEGFFRSPGLHRALLAETEREPFDLVMGYCSGVLPLALSIPADAHVMDLADVDSAKWEGYGEASGWPMSWVYRREARGVRALEQEAVERCDAVLLVSEAEVRALATRSENVFAVSNGVDMEYFAPTPPAHSGFPSLVFVGQMDYRPNADGVCGFVRDVWPGLKRSIPDLTFTIVGRSPTRAVRRLGRTPRIRVTGSVPDVRPYLAAATVAVVPLKIARGIQNKVLEAMAMGRAVMASSPALKGLDVTPGKDVLRADTTDEWHEQITKLLSDEASRLEMERAARRRIEADYSWSTRLAPLIALCERLTTPAAMRTTASLAAR